MKALVLFLLGFSSVVIAQMNKTSELSVVDRKFNEKRNDSIAVTNVNSIIQQTKNTYSTTIIGSANDSDLQKNKIQLLQNDINFNMGVNRRFVSQENGEVFSSPRAASINGLGKMLSVPIYKSK
ncbi:hypothetical protein NZ698_15835 [Chryseobacterium sp. PBS4-4]|uniref:Uncharacterized protein n=1 Tax=Chryseobacterium edaphi TaxID=2976532 RepID=A0ABT2W8X3_9FLAO|nr:hypothetical protein [Chryseobacterium edaphi]MCU7618666.1 hypothetical protein [Chryseobacterium edaphi]